MTTPTPEEIEFAARKQARIDAKRYVDDLTPDTRIGGYPMFYASVVETAFIKGRQEAFAAAIRAAEVRGESKGRQAGMEEAAKILNNAAMLAPMTADAGDWLLKMERVIRERISKVRGE